MKKIGNEVIHYSARISGFRKLLICILLASAVYAVLMFLNLSWTSCIILCWDTFALSMIAFSWILFFTTSEEELSTVVESQDEGLQIIFGIVMISVFVSLFGTIILLIKKNVPEMNHLLHTIISMSPVLLSWFLLHTIFTIRYAHLYHNKIKTTEGKGLEFPNKGKPDYVDFAYFSFVIGMTFQVSDVVIHSRLIRRFVLMHSLISFGYNTMIVALTINTISNLNS